MSPILQGGIIAAGEGSRLRADGCRASKPMVHVGGRPLIDHAVARFRAAGIRRLSVIINERSEDCREWLEGHAGDIELDLIMKTTPSSYASFKIVADRLAGAPAVITTVDGIMPTEDFRRFVGAASAFPTQAVILGVTDHVDDEAPLWAVLDPSDGRIRRLGGKSGSHVTAGLYRLPAERPAEPAAGFARLRDYLAWLVAEGRPVYGMALPRVFDIDRKRDVEAAERAAGAAHPSSCA
jgi:NDP-sugar pyrophosphorylase family protein